MGPLAAQAPCPWLSWGTPCTLCTPCTPHIPHPYLATRALHPSWGQLIGKPLFPPRCCTTGRGSENEKNRVRVRAYLWRKKHTNDRTRCEIPQRSDTRWDSLVSFLRTLQEPSAWRFRLSITLMFAFTKQSTGLPTNLHSLHADEWGCSNKSLRRVLVWSHRLQSTLVSSPAQTEIGPQMKENKCRQRHS